jgi:hypothetical protein
VGTRVEPTGMSFPSSSFQLTALHVTRVAASCLLTPAPLPGLTSLLQFIVSGIPATLPGGFPGHARNVHQNVISLWRQPQPVVSQAAKKLRDFYQILADLHCFTNTSYSLGYNACIFR